MPQTQGINYLLYSVSPRKLGCPPLVCLRYAQMTQRQHQQYSQILRADLLSKQGALDILSLANKSSRKRRFLPECPSWVPDFDKTDEVKFLIIQLGVQSIQGE